MAIANYFYNETTRKYVALFGTIFNQIVLKRKDNAGQEIQSMIVPLSYAPFQKVLARVNQDPDLLNSRRTSIRLPRMSFEMLSVTYDPARKIGSTQKMVKSQKAETNSSRDFVYSSVPYNVDFNLYIMTKYSEDATQIMEQIIPFFTPDYTCTARMVADLDPIDIPVILNSISTEELYEGNFEERQNTLYTLAFTLKGWYFGPQKRKKVIKFIDISMASSTLANTAFESRISIKPGLDEDGNPLNAEGLPAYATASLTDGRVSSIVITNDGQSYSSGTPPAVTITAPVTTNATADITVANSVVTGLTVTEGGGFYSSIPNVNITQPNANTVTALVTANIVGDAIDSITIDNAGTFYNSANVAISEAPAKSAYVKYGDDALYHSLDADQTLLHTMATNLVTTSGSGFALEFWIYPEEAPATGVHNIMHWDSTTMRIEIEPDREIVYRPNYNGIPVRSTPELLILNQWNHVRLEHFEGNARWLVNGVVDQGVNAAQGFMMGGGVNVVAGQRGSTPSFKGAIDNVILDQITSQTAVGSYTIPTTPQTGSDYTGNYDKVNATATATVTDGVVSGITITNGGLNYANSTPTVTISDPNASRADFQATATAVLTSGVVTSINITNAGKFYESANVTIDAAAAITATATSTVNASGDVSAITITNPGAGYTTVPTVTIADISSASVPYQQIEFDDNWGVITTIEDI